MGRALAAALAAFAPNAIARQQRSPPPQGPSSPQSAPPSWSTLVDVSRRVEAIVRNEKGLAAAEQVALLVALGEPVIPVLFSMRLGLPLPSAASQPEAPRDDGASGPDASLALAALRALPPEHVDSFLVDVAAHAEDAHRPIEVVRVAGDLSRARSLDVLRRVTAGMNPLLQGHPIVAGTLRQAIVTILTADARADAGLPSFLPGLPAQLAGAALEAVGSVKGGDRTTLWCELYGESEAWDRAILKELERRPPTDSAGRDRVARLLRDQAASRVPEVRRQVAQSLRLYGGLESAESLIGLLEDDDRKVCEVAHRSLREIAGVALQADPAAWRGWHAAESRWRAHEWPSLQGTLSEGTLPQVPDAELLRLLASLARKRVHAAVMVDAIGPLLHHPRTEIRLAACDALDRLGTPECLAQLKAARSDPDAKVRASVNTILSRRKAAP